MTTVDATAGGRRRRRGGRPRPPWSARWPGDPSILGLGSFIVGSVALGLGLVGVVPAGVLGAPLAIILAATALGLLMATVWCARARPERGSRRVRHLRHVLAELRGPRARPGPQLVRHHRHRRAGHGEAVPAHLARRHGHADPVHAAPAVGLHRGVRAGRPGPAAAAARLRGGLGRGRALDRPAQDRPATSCWSSPRSASTCSSARPRPAPAASPSRSAPRSSTNPGRPPLVH